MKGKVALSYLLVGALTLIAFALRVYRLDVQSLWLDEAFSHYVASRPGFVALVDIVIREDNHPPLYYLVLGGWMHFAGASEFALRFVSTVAGTLAVPLIARLGARLWNERTGYIAAALLAVSPFHIWYSQEARMYALLGLLAIVSVLLFLRWQEGASRGVALAYVVVSALMPLSHYYGIFVLLFENLAFMSGFLLRWRRAARRVGFRKWILAQGAIAALYLPWLFGIAQQFQRAPHDYRLRTSLLDVARNLNVTFSIGDLPTPLRLPGAGGAELTISLEPAQWVFLVIVIVGLVWPLRRTGGSPEGSSPSTREADDRHGWRPSGGRIMGQGTALAALYLFSTPILAYLVSMALSMNLRAEQRIYYNVILPAYLLLLAHGIGRLLRSARILGLLAIVLVVGVSLASSAAQFSTREKEDFRSTASYVMERESAGDVIVLNAEHIHPAFAYYYQGTQSWYRAEVGEEKRTTAFLERITRGSEGAWLVLSRDDLADPKGLVKRWFDDMGLMLDDQWDYGARVLYYSLEPRPNFRPPDVSHRLDAVFIGKLGLMSHELPATAKSGKQVNVTLYWRSLAQVADDYRVVTYLQDEAGRIWSQIDRVPLVPTYATSRWKPGEYLRDSYHLPVPLGTPPGLYDVKVRVYDPSSRAALQQDGTTDELVPLGKLTVLKADPGEPVCAASRLPTATKRDLNDDVAVWQWEIGKEEALAGERLDISFLWQARRKLAARYDVILQVVAGANVVQELRSTIGGDRYPTDRWDAGEMVRDVQMLSLAKSLAAGRYNIRARMVKRGDGQDSASFDLGSVLVHAPERSFAAPEPQHRYAVALADKIIFLGHDLPSAGLAPGDKLKLTAYWRAEREISDSYKVFLHLLDPAKAVVAQEDNLPAQDSRPTTGWAIGEVIADEHELVVPAETPSGEYRLELGFYDPVSGQRLVVADSGPRASDNAILLREPVIVERQK